MTIKKTAVTMTSQQAYTRTELIIVLLFIVLLAALIICPVVMASQRENAKNTRCINNLKALGTAFALYAADNDNCLPCYAKSQQVKGATTKWYIKDKFNNAMRLNQPHPELLVRSLRPYTHTDSIWFCPSDPLAHSNNFNGVNGVATVDHHYCTYATQESFANYPTTMDGFEVIDNHGKHFILGGPDKSSRCLLSEEYITVLSSEPWYAHFMPHNTPRIHPMYSHKGKLYRVAFDGHILSVDITSLGY